MSALYEVFEISDDEFGFECNVCQHEETGCDSWSEADTQGQEHVSEAGHEE